MAHQKALFGATKFYTELMYLNGIPSIIDLLNHHNTSIAVDVVGLIQDLTDKDVVGENDEATRGCPSDILFLENFWHLQTWQLKIFSMEMIN